MSRLIIKNLPKTITSEKLKEHFSTQGEVTDIQLKYTPQGIFRRFGFIGYQSEEEANRAVLYFNNTYVNQSKITVQHCSELGDATKPKAWSKYAPDSSAYKKHHTQPNPDQTKEEKKTVSNEKKKKKSINPEVAELLKKHKDDPMFLEFMEVHLKKGSKASEALKILTEDHDSGLDEPIAEENGEECTDNKKSENEEKTSTAFAPISDLEYMQMKKKGAANDKDNLAKEEKKSNLTKYENEDMPYTVKITNLAFTTKKKDIKEFFHPLKPLGIRVPPKVSGFAYVTFKTLKDMNKALIKNKSFLKNKQVCVKQFAAKDSELEKQDSKLTNEKQNRWKEQEEALMKEESIAESGSIFVRNLTYTVTEEELTKHFEVFGPLADVTFPVDRVSRKVKGFATVTFVLPEHAVAAYTKLDGTVFHGRMLHLLPAKTKHQPEEENEEKSFKEKKKDKQKVSAGQSHNWNTLFLGQNAVIDVIADKYDISKQEVLTGPDVAVRVALGETQLVLETKQFLLDSGVSLDAFNQAPEQRSKTVILAKNLPAKTTVNEIREMFCKFGELGRVVLPPSGVTGLIEFLESSEAKKAFMSLAYTKFKNLPLYLEWAPENTFSPTQDEKEAGMKNKAKEEKKDNDEAEEEINMEPEPDTMLYVKNLNFDSTEESLKKHFSKCGHVASATIVRKRDPARPGELLSMGYGFVQFYRQADVMQALKQLQNSLLDGHQLELKRSNRTVQNDAAVSRKKNNVEKQTGTKILVRNIPFQANEKEITNLFKTFGDIKALRMPKKMVGTGSHRGFAFVEFHTKHDAKRAMSALCQSTHLLGRRLVLEWAQEEETVEELRKRTAQSFRPESAPRSKKSRAEIEVMDDDEEET